MERVLARAFVPILTHKFGCIHAHWAPSHRLLGTAESSPYEPFQVILVPLTRQTPKPNPSLQLRPVLDHWNYGDRLAGPTAQPRQALFGVPPPTSIEEFGRQGQRQRQNQGLKESVTPRHFTVGKSIGCAFHLESSHRTSAVQSKPRAFNFNTGSTKNCVNHISRDANFLELGRQIANQDFQDVHLAARLCRLIHLKLKKILRMKPIVEKRLIQNDGRCESGGKGKNPLVCLDN